MVLYKYVYYYYYYYYYGQPLELFIGPISVAVKKLGIIYVGARAANIFHAGAIRRNCVL